MNAVASQDIAGMAPVDVALLVAQKYPVHALDADKKPATEHGFKDATRDPAAIRSQFANPRAELIGVPTGHASGLLVVDVDPAGIPWLRANLERLPPTRVHHTRRGRHFLFRMPAEHVGCSKGKVAPGVDIRANGGYIAYWPAAGLPVDNPKLLAEAPEWLLELARGGQLPATAANADDPFGQHRPKTGIPLDRAVQLLPYLDVDSYDDWLGAGMAFEHEYDGSEEALRAWMQWSRSSDKYPGEDECRKKWESFGRYSGKPATLRTIINAAKRNGAPPELWGGASSSAAPAPADTLTLVNAAPTFDPVRAAIGADTFHRLPPEPPFLVPGLLPLDIGSTYGAGGVSKTTLYLFAAVHIVTGRALFGHPVAKPGKVLLVSAEDDIARVRHRLHAIGRGLELTNAEISLLSTNLLVEDVTGKNARLVESDERGNLSQSALVDGLIEAYRDAGIVLMLIDPAVSFGPGERFVNDGEQALVTVAARIKRELGCAVGFAHHTGKGNARAGVTDQYAGRGGSALSDGMRWVWVLTPHDKDDSEHKAPLGVPTAAIAEGRLLRLHIAKLTDAPRPRDPIWILRTGFTFERVMPQVRTEDEKRTADLHRLLGFMRGELDQGIRHTKNSLEGAAKRIGLGRNDIRDLIHVGIELGEIVERELPPDEQRARRQHYLDPGSDPDISVEAKA